MDSKFLHYIATCIKKITQNVDLIIIIIDSSFAVTMSFEENLYTLVKSDFMSSEAK